MIPIIIIVIIGILLLVLAKRTGQASIPSLPSEELDDKIKRWAALNNLDWKLVKAICLVESSLNANAMGKAGEYGLMQILPATAKGYGATDKTNLLDPDENLKYGCKFLAYTTLRYGPEAGIQIYHLGETRYLKGERADDYLVAVRKAFRNILI